MTTPTPENPWQRAIKRADKHAIPVEHLGGEVWQAGSASRPGEWWIVTVSRDEVIVS